MVFPVSFIVQDARVETHQDTAGLSHTLIGLGKPLEFNYYSVANKLVNKRNKRYVV